MLTLKFGGTSMGSAQRILDSVEIMIGRANKDRISVVVSAVAGVSNKLQEAIDGCVSGQAPDLYVQQLRSTHTDILAELKSTLPSLNTEAVTKKIDPLFEDLKKLLSAISAFGECPDNAHCRIMGMGELLCSPIVEAVLVAKGQSVLLLDSRKFIFTTGSQKEGDPDYARCAEALASYRESSSARILCSLDSSAHGLVVLEKSLFLDFWDATEATLAQQS